MSLPTFYKKAISSTPILSLVEEMVLHHQPTLEDSVQEKIGDILIEPLDTNSFFSRTSDISSTPMLSWPFLKKINVNENYFAGPFVEKALKHSFAASAFIEYIALHEMSHLVFGANAELFAFTLDSLAMKPNKNFAELNEGFANALAVGYLEKYYGASNNSLQTNTILHTYLPMQIQTFSKKPYFLELLKTYRSKPVSEFFDQAISFSETILNKYAVTNASGEEKAKSLQTIQLSLGLHF